MSYYANIEGHSGYVKDKRNGAVLNTNKEEIEAAKKLHDAGMKAHSSGDHAKSEELLKKALGLFKS